jgi:hypothetical protein
MTERKLTLKLRVPRWALAVVLVWLAITVAGLAWDNPLTAIRRVAADSGGWDSADLRFRSGSYSYRLLFYATRGELFASTLEGTIPVSVEFWHFPFMGTVVRCYAAGSDTCAA